MPDQLAPSRFDALQILATAVVVTDETANAVYLNQAAEQLLEVSRRAAQGQPVSRLLGHDASIQSLLDESRANPFGVQRQDVLLVRHEREPLRLDAMATALDDPPGGRLLELREIDQRVRLDREERMLDLAQGNRELVRNLAHEIKNPLGGVRGAAQLLESELPDAGLREYTQVIIKEADRLQTLVDRLLAPHRQPRIVGDVNIHEVCERVRSVLLAEYSRGLEVRRDYDASIPEFRGDKEQLIQAVLNLVRNAAQAMQGTGCITLRTRVARQVTIARRKCRLALDLHVADDGPGIPASIRDRIFFPLVSGREGGSGLGLTLTQTFVQQHGGTIECESRPGRTVFRVLLPLA